MAACNLVVGIKLRFGVLITYVMIKLNLPVKWYIKASFPRVVKKCL